MSSVDQPLLSVSRLAQEPTVLVTEDADAHVGAGNGREADGSRETLVTLRVIVLETDLKLDCLLQSIELARLMSIVATVSAERTRKFRFLVFCE
jgi:hypothetical protein